MNAISSHSSKILPGSVAGPSKVVASPAKTEAVAVDGLAGSVPAKPASPKDAVKKGGDRFTRFVDALSGAALFGGLGLVAATAAPALGPALGAVAGGAAFSVGEACRSKITRGLGLAALGGAICFSGALSLGAVPLLLGVGMLGVAGANFKSSTSEK